MDFDVPFEFLKEGTNLIAVEVHQNMPTSSDLVFDMSLSYTPVERKDLYTNPVFSQQLTQNLRIKAIYEDVGTYDPNESAVIKINEIVASNSIYKDEYGEAEDYIELYNPGEEDVNIAGWFCQIGRLILRCILFQRQIPPNPYSRERQNYCLGRFTTGTRCCTSFNLSKDGETVVFPEKILTVSWFWWIR